jgi:hypothetical protein
VSQDTTSRTTPPVPTSATPDNTRTPRDNATHASLTAQPAPLPTTAANASLDSPSTESAATVSVPTDTSTQMETALPARLVAVPAHQPFLVHHVKMDTSRMWMESNVYQDVLLVSISIMVPAPTVNQLAHPAQD